MDLRKHNMFLLSKQYMFCIWCKKSHPIIVNYANSMFEYSVSFINNMTDMTDSFINNSVYYE